MTDTVALSRFDACRADAARYNIMWRLVPSVNHKLAGSMQPMTMLAGMLARHLQRGQHDPQVLIKLATDMQLACKAAITTRTDVLAWFQPSEQKLVAIEAEVAQCTSMLTAEYAIQGCSIDNQVAGDLTSIRQTDVRTMLTAALFGILDNAPGPVAVRLGTLPSNSHGCTIVLTWTDLLPSDLLAKSSASHAIDWDGIQAIANQTSVLMRREGTQCDLQFAVVTGVR